jgi:hypothetical protein
MAVMTFQIESQLDVKPSFFKKTYSFKETCENTPSISLAEGLIEIGLSHLDKVNLLIVDCRSIPVGKFLRMSITKDDGINPPIVNTMEIEDWTKLTFTDLFGTDIKKVSFETDSETEFKFYFGAFSNNV